MKKSINYNKFNQNNNNKKEENKMKKLLKATILSTILFTALTGSVYANSTKVDLYVNNTKLNPDSPAYISNTNRTMVPISFIANALKFEVNWNAKAEEVVIKDAKTNKTIKLYINNKYALVNNNKVEVDEGKGTAPVIKNSRTMVPLSFITNNFGVETKWTKLAVDHGRVDMTKEGLVVEVPSTPISQDGILTDAQSKYVADKINLSVAGSGFKFEDGVNKLTEKQRERTVKDFLRDISFSDNTELLVSKDTIHDPGFVHAAGLEIKTENGIKYQRVFNVGISYNNGKIELTTPVGYRSNWEKVN